MSVISVMLLIAMVSGCARTEDDGYLSPPLSKSDRFSVLERVHEELRTTNYRHANQSDECQDDCDALSLGYERAKRLKIESPAACAHQFGEMPWSQNAYQEGCRAYALRALALLDRYRLERDNDG
jgi:hypothetical protein